MRNSRSSALSQVVQNFPFSNLDFQQANRLYGASTSVIRGQSTYEENVGSSKYLKQNVENVVLYMDILHDDDLRFVAAISDVGAYHHISYVPNSKEQTIRAAISDAVNCWTSSGHKVELVAWECDTIQHLAATLQVRYDVATGTHQGQIENSARQWGNLVRSWRAQLRQHKIETVPKSIRVLADLSLYQQLNLMPTSHNAGNITPQEFFSGVRPSFDRYYRFSAMQLYEVHTGIGPKRLNNKQYPYNSKQYQRTEPCLALQPVGTASNSYAFVNLRTGKRVVSHVAFPRIMTMKLEI